MQQAQLGHARLSHRSLPAPLSRGLRRLRRGGGHVETTQPPAQGNANPAIIALADHAIGVSSPTITPRVGLVEGTGDSVQSPLIAQARQMIDLNLTTITRAETAMYGQPHRLPLIATVADRSLVSTPCLRQAVLPGACPLRVGVP
jgi:uncharacterized protein YggU (UPF0235/DUF167 family)